jgi:hypothetical protein
MRIDSPAAYCQRSLGESMELVQIGLLMAVWVVAFLLGKELRTGFQQWRQSRRRE